MNNETQLERVIRITEEKECKELSKKQIENRIESFKIHIKILENMLKNIG